VLLRTFWWTSTPICQAIKAIRIHTNLMFIVAQKLYYWWLMVDLARLNQAFPKKLCHYVIMSLIYQTLDIKYFWVIKIIFFYYKMIILKNKKIFYVWKKTTLHEFFRWWFKVIIRTQKNMFQVRKSQKFIWELPDVICRFDPSKTMLSTLKGAKKFVW
jgi:hypothetical protein